MITVLLTLILIGLLLWAVNTYIPMAAPIKNILNVVAVILVVFWLLSVFGVLGAIGNSPVPQFHTHTYSRSAN
jgi:hypothetical protein